MFEGIVKEAPSWQKRRERKKKRNKEKQTKGRKKKNRQHISEDENSGWLMVDCGGTCLPEKKIKAPLQVAPFQSSLTSSGRIPFFLGPTQHLQLFKYSIINIFFSIAVVFVEVGQNIIFAISSQNMIDLLCSSTKEVINGRSKRTKLRTKKN